MKRSYFEIGLDLPIPAKQYLKDTVNLIGSRQDLGKYTKLVNWINPEYSYIPIINLGRVSENRLNTAIEVAKASYKQFSPFATNFGYLTYFFQEKQGNDSLVIMQVQDKDQNLKNIYKTLFNALAQEAFHPPTRFKPLVPLCKVKKPRYTHELQDALDKITEVELPRSKPFQVNTLVIFRITGDKSGKQITRKLRSFILNKSSL